MFKRSEAYFWQGALSIALVMAATPALAQKDNEHLCTATDLHGPFVMINLTETPEGMEASWYRQAPYHYLVFYANNTYSSGAFDHPLDKLADLTEALKAKSNPEFKYKIGPEGVLDLIDNSIVQYSYRCYAVTETSNENQKGDIILSGHAKGNPSNLVKLYRPVTKDADVR